MSSGNNEARDPLELFIYFRAPAREDSAVLERLRRHRERLAALGISLRFWRRIDASTPGDHTTWMEGCVAPRQSIADVQARIAASARLTGLESLAQGPRHVEIFEPAA
jgi:hypothetical protein